MALGLAGVPSKASGPFTGKTPTESKTRLGLYAAPQGNFGQSTRNPSVTVGSDPKTRLGLGAYSRGPLGDTTGKVTTPSQEVVFSNTPSATYAPATFTVARDRVIDFTGIEVAPVTYDFEIIQGGQTVSFDAATSTWAGKTFVLDQETPGNRNIVFETAASTYTAQSFVIAQERIIDFNVALSSYQTLSFDIVPGVFGEQTLSNADIFAIFNNYKIDGYSLHELMAGMAAMLMGESENADKQGTAVYKSVRGDGTVRVAGSTDGRGNRFGVTRTLR